MWKCWSGTCLWSLMFLVRNLFCGSHLIIVSNMILVRHFFYWQAYSGPPIKGLILSHRYNTKTTSAHYQESYQNQESTQRQELSCLYIYLFLGGIILFSHYIIVTFHITNLFCVCVTFLLLVSICTSLTLLLLCYHSHEILL